MNEQKENEVLNTVDVPADEQAHNQAPENISTIEEAKSYMEQSTSVDDWNERRWRLKQAITTSTVLILGWIDGSGLIVKVLGQDPLPYWSRAYNG